MKITDIAGLVKEFKQLPKDIHFASVVALTRMAKQIQGVVREEMTKDFTLRNRFTQSSIKITGAQKKDKVPFSEVYSAAWYLPTQDTGGVRSGDYWIPGDALYRKLGIPKTKVIPRGSLGENILKKRFVIRSGSRGIRNVKSSKLKARPFIFKARSGKRFIGVRDTTLNLPVSVLYQETKKPRIKSKEFFEKPSEEEFQKNFEALYDAAWQQYVVDRRV